MLAKQLNLLNTFPKLARDIESRKYNKEINKKLALKFDYEYFDGSRDQGYGGYSYDGRWVDVAKKLVDIFKLTNNSKFLDVGCAKGFLMYDLYNINNLISIMLGKPIQVTIFILKIYFKKIKDIYFYAINIKNFN